MRRRVMLGIVAALGIAGGVAAQQEMLPRPGPGSGVTPVSQRGNWDVAISNTPTVRVVNAVPVRLGVPSFVRNATFEITWANGDKEAVTVVRFDRQEEARANEGWVEVRSGGKARWVNLAMARSVEER